MKLFKRKPKPRVLNVGDRVPADILAEWETPEAGRLLGAMISVCPCCKRIDAIHVQ